MINVFMAYIPQQTTSLCVWGTQKGDNLLTKSHEEAYIYTLKKEKKEKKKIYIYMYLYIKNKMEERNQINKQIYQ